MTTAKRALPRLLAFLLGLGLPACGHPQPAPARSAPAAIVRGRITVGPSIDPSIPRSGTLVLYWMTKGDLDTLMSDAGDLTGLAHLLDHLALVGPVDLSAPGAGVAYELPVEPGDLVVSAFLDSQHDAIGSMLGAVAAPGDGDLTGDGEPVHVDGLGERDIVLTTVQAHADAGEACTGERHQLVLLDAPEVAGAMGNATHRRLCVVLPASYAAASARRYPVIYELPGWGSDDANMIATYHHDQIFADAGVDAILVLVDTSTRSGSSYLVDSPRTGAWDRYLTARVVPAIDARYRTIATPAGRATAGLSTGGFGALSLGLRHPEVFGVVTASAPDGPDVTAWQFGDPGGPVPAWTLAMVRVEAATGGAGFFASWGNDWSPDDSPRGWALPIDLASGAPVPAVMARWRAQGPSIWLDDPARAAALVRSFAGKLCLTVGKRDEFGLYPALQAFADKATRVGLTNQLLLADGGHIDPEVMTLAYRCAGQRLAPAR